MTAAADSLVTNSILFCACWMVSNMLRFYVPRGDRYWYVLILCISLTLIVSFSSQAILLRMERLGATYFLFLKNSLWLRAGIYLLLVVCMSIICVLWYSLEDEQDSRQRKNDAEKLSREAELYKLRQQLQPHFLFNSLNSISALTGSQPERARTMIHQLSDFLRATLRREEEQWVKMEEELQTLELYLEIEKVRFGHRLSTKINKDEKSLQLLLPPMLLQPVMENAIKFGLYDTTDDVNIVMSVCNVDGYLQVTITNPFDSETSTPRQGTGFGLASVKRRLYLLFARNDLVETRIEEQHFSTIIKIPQQS